MPKRRLKGTVVSDKMEKTVVVAVERVFAHPVYKKRIGVTKRFQADDRSGGASVGKKVVIEETKPLSKNKRWLVVEIEGEPVRTDFSSGKKAKKEEKKTERKPPKKKTQAKKGKKK